MGAGAVGPSPAWLEDRGAAGKDRGTAGTVGARWTGTARGSSGGLSRALGQERGPRRGGSPAPWGLGPRGTVRRRCSRRGAWGGLGVALQQESVQAPWGPPRAGGPALRQAGALGPGALGDGALATRAKPRASGPQGRLWDRHPLARHSWALRYRGAEASWGAGVLRAPGGRPMAGAPGSLWVRGGATKLMLTAPEVLGAGQARARGHWEPQAGRGVAGASRAPLAGQQARRGPRSTAKWRQGAQGLGAKQGSASAKRGRTPGLACRDLGVGGRAQLVPRRPG